MAHPRRSLLVVALALLGAAPLRADVVFGRDFNNYCTTGALRACASASLELSHTADGGSVLLIRFRNLQGVHYADNTNGWRMTGFSFGTLERGGQYQGLAGYGTAGSVGIYGNPDITHPFNPVAPFVPGPGGPAPGAVFAWHNGSQAHGLMGCTDLPLDAEPPPSGAMPFRGAWRTCAPMGYDGSYYVAIRLSWALQRADMLFATWQGEAADGTYVACDTRSPETCVTVTPEPLTIVLLGTGAAALAGARARRRKTHGDAGAS